MVDQRHATRSPFRPILHKDAERYRSAGFWSDAPLGARLAQTCRRLGGRLALVDGDWRFTFADLDRLSRLLAERLSAIGVKPGDVVAYQLPNWWEAVITFLAAARLGAVVNPILPIFRERELSFILQESGASVLLIPGSFRKVDHRQLLRDLLPRLPALRHLFVVRDEAPAGMRSFRDFLDTVPEPSGAPAGDVTVDPASIALLMYTSGTTADPKGVLHTHQTLTAEIDSLARVHALTPRDRTLMPSPLTHISGVIHAILVPALHGTAAVLMDRWDPAAALPLMARERVTYMVGAPTFLQDLCVAAEVGAHDLSSLRLFSCGGANVSADLIRRARRQLGCLAKRVYGSTEFPTITTTDPEDADSMGVETEGRAIFPAEVRAVDETGTVLPADHEGEIQARGPECFVGYANPALNVDAFTPDGWFRTGDLGRLDAGGYLRITGRVKEIVIRKGEKFSLRELEDLIARHPAVAEAVVVAVPDPQTGERACAVVELRAGHQLTLDELAAFLLRHGLARQKLPEQLVVHPSLPRTESGKVQRAAVKSWLLQESRQ